MSRLLAYLAVLAAAATPWLEVLVVVPAGILGGLGATPTVVVAAIGNIATLVPVVLLGGRLRAWILGRRGGRGRGVASSRARASAASRSGSEESASLRSDGGHAAWPGDLRRRGPDVPRADRGEVSSHGDPRSDPTTERLDPAGAGAHGDPPSHPTAEWLDPAGAGAHGDPRGGDETSAGPTGRPSRARRLLARYGLPGLALLGPLVTGAHVAALVATGSGASPRRTLLWMSAGVVLWGIVAAVLTVLGAEILVGRGVPLDLPGT